MGQRREELLERAVLLPEMRSRAELLDLGDELHITVVATSLVGTWVVLRGLAFLGDALAHGVIPGIALAVLWGFSPVVGALAAAAAMGGLVSLVTARTQVREDTGIGLLFVGMLSLGIVIVSKARSFSTEVTSLLFGDVLGVTESRICQIHTKSVMSLRNRMMEPGQKV